MDNSPRKASDIILSLEQKIEQLIKSNNSLDLNLKILSNKINKVVEKLETTNVLAPSPIFSSNVLNASNSENTMETETDTFINHHNDGQSVLIQKNEALTLSEEPTGFRRTSRPDTIKKNMPASIINAPIPAPVEVPQSIGSSYMNSSKVPVQQRVVDKNGKAMYMADVEIVNSDTRQMVFKGRTSAIGKWIAPLDIGQYKVTIKKHESATKEKIEISQNLLVDGSKTPLELPIVIAK